MSKKENDSKTIVIESEEKKPSFNFCFIVTNNFRDYVKGSHISDQEEIERIIKNEEHYNCNKIPRL